MISVPSRTDHSEPTAKRQSGSHKEFSEQSNSSVFENDKWPNSIFGQHIQCKLAGAANGNNFDLSRNIDLNGLNVLVSTIGC